MLVQRLSADLLHQVGDDCGVPPADKFSFVQVCQAAEPPLGETLRLAVQRRYVDAGVRFAAPEVHRLPYPLNGLRGVGGEESAPFVEQRFEALDVELAGIDPKPIAAGFGGESPGVR